jgi:signal transduction histidine kinase
MMKALAIACWLLLALLCGHARAATDTTHLADLHREIWTSKEGAPTDIFSMAQTTDGWLWLSTNNGLYRFDGVRFERFRPRQGEALRVERLTNMYAAPDGALWFGYSGGGGAVTELRNGRLTHHAPAGLDVGSMYGAQRGPDGSLWLADGTSLLQYANGAWRRLGPADGLGKGTVAELYVDQYGRVWTTIGGRVFVRRHPGTRFVLARPDEGNGGFAAAPDGRVWLETATGMTVLDRPARAGLARPGRREASSAQFLFDRAGNLWTLKSGTTFCFVRASELAGRTGFLFATMPHEQLTVEQQGRVRPHAFLEDREGNVWVATSKGLERYRPQRVHHLPMDRKYGIFALANDGPDALWVVAKPQGDLWHVTGDALTQVPGRFGYHMVDSSPGGAAIFAGTRGIEQRARGQFDATAIRDAQGRLAPMPDARSGFFDGKNYWASTNATGAQKLTPAGWRKTDALGFPAGRAKVRVDPRGHLWLLYDDKIIDTGQTPSQVHAKADGLDIGVLHSLEVQQEVTALGDAGVAVRIGARFYRLRIDRPELLTNARGIIVSANGDRWINGNRGLIQIRATDWQAWLAQPQGTLPFTSFDAADGNPGAQGSQPSSMATTDNGTRVWFVSKDGPAWIDSTETLRQVDAPRVEVLQLHAGALAWFGDDSPRLAAGTTNLGIDFAALSYSMPERIRFKYRLDGLDDAWQDGGTRRSVAYTNLGPGTYRFQVLATGEDGVWGTAPATMAFSIAPLPTQTWWFFALCGVAVLLTLSLLYRARVRSVRKHVADRLQERLYERERIARSLHDTYLQSVQGLIYVFHGLAQTLPADGATQPALGRALAMADDVLIQGREQVMGLRTSAGGAGTLAQSLAEICQALAAHDAVTCSVRISGAERPLHGHVMEELFYIGREALINAVRHAQGTRVDLTLHYGARKFIMCIQDDGIGLPPAMLTHGKRDGHWGLPGMRERAGHLHGVLALSNVPDGGARIMLTVPGRTVYVRPASTWQALARRWQGVVNRRAGAPGLDGQG